MAKRESQGMQIALILLIMFCLLFAITTVVFWNQSKTAHAEIGSLKAKEQTAQTEVSSKSLENQELKTWLGFEPDSSLETIRPQVEQDFLVFGQNYPPEQQNYRELPAFLMKTVQDQHSRLQTAANLEDQLESEREAARSQERTNVKTAEDNHQKAFQDLAQEREKFSQELGSLRSDWSARETKHNQQLEKKDRRIASMMQEVDQLKTDLDALQLSNKTLTTQLSEYRTESFDQPNGQITWVNQSLGTAYINIGRVDGLQTRSTFSVYDVDENNIARSDRKGSIEITRVLSDHLAEARVLDDELTNPIIPGDVIYSPVFQAGAAVRFAVAGTMDIDGDGESDNDLIRNLIRINGGVIDAEVDSDGKRSGKLSINTRYLIVGEEATDQTSKDLRDAQGQILAEAQKVGVTVISVDEFLHDIGYKPAVTRDGDAGVTTSGPDPFRYSRVP